MTSVKSQRYGPRAHSTPDFSANITPAMCRALNGEVWGSCALAGGRSSLFEGVRVAGAYDLAPLDYDAVPLYRFAVEVGLEAAANAVGVALLRVQDVPETCGVIAWFGIVRHGWSSAAGWESHTSPAYPANWPSSSASTRASRSTTAPRAVLTIQAPLFMLNNRSRSNSPLVAGVRGAWMLITSHSGTSSSMYA